MLTLMQAKTLKISLYCGSGEEKLTISSCVEHFILMWLIVPWQSKQIWNKRNNHLKAKYSKCTKLISFKFVVGPYNSFVCHKTPWLMRVILLYDTEMGFGITHQFILTCCPNVRTNCISILHSMMSHHKALRHTFFRQNFEIIHSFSPFFVLDYCHLIKHHCCMCNHNYFNI